MTGEAAFKIGKMPRVSRGVALPHGHDDASDSDQGVAISGTSACEARMLSLDGEWFSCQIACPRDLLWFDQAAQPVIGGMSGSPIVLPDGSAVGVVCASDSGHSSGRTGGPNPMLAAHLPGWLLEQR